MRELQSIRADINEIDKRMRKLFLERLSLAREIAEYKKARGLEIYDPQRENQVIEQNTNELEDKSLEPYYLNFLKSNMEISRAYQHTVISESSSDD